MHGKGKALIRGVSDPRTADAEHITCLGDDRYRTAALSTKAAAILVKKGTKYVFPCPSIEVENPVGALARLTAEFAGPIITWNPGIHPTAIISPQAKIGEGSYVGPYVVIEEGVEIGKNSHIGAGSYIGHASRLGEGVFLFPRVTLYERTLLGNRVVIHSGAVIGADGFGYEFKAGRHVKIPQLGFVQVDDEVEIGANATIDRGRFDRTWIQEGCKIDNLVMIAHNCVIGKHSVLVAQCGISGSTHLGSYVTIAGQAGLVGHLTIEDRATVTAQSGVSKNIETGAIYSGSHARPMKEALKIEALVQRLPELVERVRKLEGKRPKV